MSRDEEIRARGERLRTQLNNLEFINALLKASGPRILGIAPPSPQKWVSHMLKPISVGGARPKYIPLDDGRLISLEDKSFVGYKFDTMIVHPLYYG